MTSEMLLFLLAALQMNSCASQSPAVSNDAMKISELLRPGTKWHSSTRHTKLHHPHPHRLHPTALLIHKMPAVEPQEEQKRLTLYPTMNFDNDQPVTKVKHQKSAAWRKHRRPMLWFWPNGNNGMKSAKSSKSLGRRERPARESIQTCLFFSGCEKIQRTHNTNRMANLEQNMDVQERIIKGLVLNRNEKMPRRRMHRGL